MTEYLTHQGSHFALARQLTAKCSMQLQKPADLKFWAHLPSSMFQFLVKILCVSLCFNTINMFGQCIITLNPSYNKVRNSKTLIVTTQHYTTCNQDRAMWNSSSISMLYAFKHNLCWYYGSTEVFRYTINRFWARRQGRGQPILCHQHAEFELLCHFVCGPRLGPRLWSHMTATETMSFHRLA